MGCGPLFDIFDVNKPRGELVKVQITASPVKSRISLLTHRDEPVKTRCPSPCTVKIHELGLYKVVIEHEDFPTQTHFTTAFDLTGLGEPHFHIGWYDMEEVQRGATQCEIERKAYSAENADTAPCHRVPPIMPPEAERSGHCQISFDVDADGTPQNIEAEYCTEIYYEEYSRHSVSNWLYFPKYEQGKPVVRKDVESKLSFILQDELGREIRERHMTEEQKRNWRKLK